MRWRMAKAVMNYCENERLAFTETHKTGLRPVWVLEYLMRHTATVCTYISLSDTRWTHELLCSLLLFVQLFISN